MKTTETKMGKATKLKVGARVRFDRDSLGACPPDEHWAIVRAKPVKGDEGTIVAQHENRKMCRDWWWAEWKAPDGETYHVGITVNMVTVLARKAVR